MKIIKLPPANAIGVWEKRKPKKRYNYKKAVRDRLDKATEREIKKRV